LSVTETKTPVIEPEIKLYPNPSENVIYIEGFNLVNFNYQIISVNGSILTEDNAVSGQEIDVSHLASGLYFIKINTEQYGQTIKRFIKK